MYKQVKALKLSEHDKKNKWIDAAVFLLLLGLASAVTFILFHRQTLGSEAAYHSDMKAYILEMQGLNTKYDFPYPVFFKLSALIHLFTGPETAVAIATMLLNSLGIVITKLALNHLTLKQLQSAFTKCKWLAGIIISMLAVALFFVSMLFPPQGIYLPGIRYNYVGVFTSNPFHNATYMAARPFAILAFLWYVKLLPVYENGCSGKWRSSEGFGQIVGGTDSNPPVIDYVLFAGFLLLATMTKPSFTIVLVGAAGLIMLWRMFRSKFRNFVPTIQLGLCFIPTFIDLLYQYKGVFVPDTADVEGGIGFCFGEVWGLYCENIPMAICLAIGFPLAVLVCNFKELKNNTLYRFSWQIYLMGFVMAFFLYEKGFRKPDFNFSWGYMYGIFFAFLGALTVLIPATASKKKPALLVLQWLAFLWHVACGLYYFLGIFQGKMYY